MGSRAPRAGQAVAPCPARIRWRQSRPVDVPATWYAGCSDPLVQAYDRTEEDDVDLTALRREFTEQRQKLAGRVKRIERDLRPSA